MKKTDTFADRRQDAEAAKTRRLEKFKAGHQSPEAVARATAREAQSSAQLERNAALELERRTRADRIKAEADAAAEEKRLAEDEELTRSAAVTEAQAVIDEASRKAKRDARYASRKARS